MTDQHSTQWLLISSNYIVPEYQAPESTEVIALSVSHCEYSAATFFPSRFFTFRKMVSVTFCPTDSTTLLGIAFNGEE